MLVGDVVKLVGGICGCGFCTQARENWHTVSKVCLVTGHFDLEDLDAGFTEGHGTWIHLPTNLEND